MFQKINANDAIPIVIVIACTTPPNLTQKASFTLLILSPIGLQLKLLKIPLGPSTTSLIFSDPKFISLITFSKPYALVI